jgi:dynein light intermediate chain 2
MASNFVDIFSLAEEEESKSNESKNLDRTVVFVGEKGSGKSSIINLLKGAQKDEGTKPTYAMEYSFSKRTTNNRKEVVHMYELGGGRQLVDLVGAPLTRESYKYIVFVIVIDLSKPSTLMDSLQYWINAIKEVATNAERSGDLPAEDLDYMRNLTQFPDHEDRSRLNPVNLPILVLGNKYDIYEGFDPENRKWISRMMRYLSHMNGCSLFYSSLVNQKLSLQIRTLLNNYFFGVSLPTLMQKDYTKPLFLTAGSDSFESMGIPTSGNMTAIDVLNKMTRDYFPPEKEEHKEGKTVYYDPSKYPESKIDSAKLEKNLEMERVHKIKHSESPSSASTKSMVRDTSEILDNPRMQTQQKQQPAENGGEGFRPLGGGPVKKMRPVNRVQLNQNPNN